MANFTGIERMRPATRADLGGLPVNVAPTLLGAVLQTRVDAAEVALRITEVEAYHGLGTGEIPDPGSHARMGRTPRNETMWGEPGHLYVYLSHGIHSCVNVVAGPDGVVGGILLRAGEVISGAEVATSRRELRGVVRAPRDLARGPGRLGDAVRLRHPIHDGLDAVGGFEQGGAVARLWMPVELTPRASISSGPRVGVAGVAGTAAFPWRFWLTGDETVSDFRWGRGASVLK